MRFRVIAVLIGLASVAVACGSDDPSGAGSRDAAGALAATAQDELLASTTSTTSTTSVPPNDRDDNRTHGERPP